MQIFSLSSPILLYYYYYYLNNYHYHYHHHSLTQTLQNFVIIIHLMITYLFFSLIIDTDYLFD